MYTELLETRRQYICGTTPSWALPSLLSHFSGVADVH
jgi:hypothetical protein